MEHAPAAAAVLQSGLNNATSAGTAVGFVQRVDDWFTLHYAGYDWSTSGLTGTLPWKELPLSSVWAPIIGVSVYLIGIVAVGRIMRDRAAIKCERALLVHNFLLTAFSVVMFIGTVRFLIGHYLQHGFFAVWMDPDWLLPRSSIPWWNYVFYVSKYYEFLDTLFLLLKKKQPTAVQIWHHASVVILFWSCLNARISIQVVPVMANSFAHIFVYGYFCASSLKIRVPWKRFITLVQIGQFVFDIMNGVPWPIYKLQGRARGDWGPIFFGHFIALTYTVLFSRVYLRIQRERQEKLRLKLQSKQA